MVRSREQKAARKQARLAGVAARQQAKQDEYDRRSQAARNLPPLEPVVGGLLSVALRQRELKARAEAGWMSEEKSK